MACRVCGHVLQLEVRALLLKLALRCLPRSTYTQTQGGCTQGTDLFECQELGQALERQHTLNFQFRLRHGVEWPNSA